MLVGTEYLIQSVADRFFDEDDENNETEKKAETQPTQPHIDTPASQSNSATPSISTPTTIRKKSPSLTSPTSLPTSSTPINVSLPMSIHYTIKPRTAFRLYPPPKLFFKVTIPSLVDNPHKTLSFLSDPENVIFQIHGFVISINTNKLEANRPIKDVIIHCKQVTTERRHSEITKLSSQLLQSYPYLILPPHPSKPNRFHAHHTRGNFVSISEV